MPAPSSVDDLLLELARGDVEPERYSRRSLYARCEPVLGSAALAVLAIGSGVLLGGWSCADQQRHADTGPRRQLLARATGRNGH